MVKLEVRKALKSINLEQKRGLFCVSVSEISLFEEKVADIS